jgi:uncharacterized Rmd1/YagE family protein
MKHVSAYHLATSINIRKCRAILSKPLLYSDSDELFYSFGEEKYVYVFQYGMVAFYGCTTDEIQLVIQSLEPGFTKKLIDSFEEGIGLKVSTSADSIQFDQVFLADANEEAIRLVMLNASQSVALDRYADVVEKLLFSTNAHTQYLGTHGKLDISGKKLKRFIGKTLELKNEILENLYIFDAPDVTWESERLNSLNIKLKQTFDLKDRYRFINERLEIVKDNLQLFKSIMDHKESSRLEWIIILLILVEVLDHFIVKFF